MLDRLAHAALATVLASALLGGCFIQPYDYQNVGYDAWFNVSGYTDTPSSLVSIEVLNETGGWEQIATAVSSSSPTYPTGWLTQNSPNLYYFGTQARVVDPADPATDRRWAWGISTSLRMRNLTHGTNLYGGDEDSLGCFFNTKISSSDFYAVAYDCGWDSTQITIVNGLIP